MTVRTMNLLIFHFVHSVSVAERYGQLSKLITWYKSSKQCLNMWTLPKSSPSSPKKPGAKPNQRQKKTKNKLPVMTYSKSPLISKSTDPPLLSSYPCPPGPDSHTEPFPFYSHSPYNDSYYRFHYSSTATPYYLPPTPYYPPPTPYYPPPMQMSSPQIQHNHNPFIAVVRSGNISKCASCGGSFTKDKQVIVIKHVEKDIYTKEG